MPGNLQIENIVSDPPLLWCLSLPPQLSLSISFSLSLSLSEKCITPSIHYDHMHYFYQDERALPENLQNRGYIFLDAPNVVPLTTTPFSLSLSLSLSLSVESKSVSPATLHKVYTNWAQQNKNGVVLLVSR
jgi:hypothetical protein